MKVEVVFSDHIGSYHAGQVAEIEDGPFLRAVLRGGKAEVLNPPDWTPETLGGEPVRPEPVPEVPVPEAPVPEIQVSEVPVPEVPVSEVPVSEVPVPEVPVSEVPEQPVIDPVPIETGTTNLEPASARNSKRRRNLNHKRGQQTAASTEATE